MMVRLYNVIAILSIAHLLALLALAGWMFQSGRLNAETVDEIVRILRNDAQEETVDESVIEPTPEEPHTVGGSAEELREQRRRNQLRLSAMDRAASDLRAQQDLVRQLLLDLVERGEQFDEAVATWERRKKAQLDELEDAGFRKQVELVSKLPARQAKDVLVRKFQESPADAVRLLNALRSSVSKAILEQMKTPEESAVRYELLEQLAKQDIDRLAPRTGMTAGGAR